MKQTVAIIATAIAVFAACQGCPPPSPVIPPDPQQDSGYDVLRPCELACLHLHVLGCESAEPTPNGATCVEVCEHTESLSYTTMHPDCIPLAANCDEADQLSADGCDD